MPSTELLLAFLVTTALFAFTPGPAMLYAAAQTLARGRWPGLMASLGIHLGGYVHVIAAAAGLTVLFEAVPTVYLTVKFAGAAYLVWLGISMFLAKGRTEVAVADSEPRSSRRAFLDSITTEALNPKTAIFFTAFLPQFIDTSGSFPVWLQFALLGTMVNLMFSFADVVCVMLAGVLMARLRRSGRAQRLMQRAGGVVLVGLGVDLAFEDK